MRLALQTHALLQATRSLATLSALGLLMGCSGCNSSGSGQDSGVVADVPSIVDSPNVVMGDVPNAPLVVTSTSFAMNDPIPPKYATQRCGAGAMNVSPALSWTGAPAGTQSFALIFRDPDVPGGGFTHWIAWNIPATTTMLAEGVQAADFIEGTSDFGQTGYGGPCPPPPEQHHYVFTIYALDVATLPLESTDVVRSLRTAMQGHILAQGAITGLYRQ